MPLSLPRITISAPHRSSGKSTITIGLCAALTAKGLKVQPFKKGPDFIDPMWHEAASGRPSRNLDIFMFGADNALGSFVRHASAADISVIEGNMGLYDGLDMLGSDSTAGLARLLKSPVVLVVDCSGMNRGIAPLVKGFESFEPDTNIAGVILNRVKNARHEKKLRDAVEYYCDAKVLGALPDMKSMGITMRHLGLIPYREDETLLPVIDAMRGVITDNLNLEDVMALAGTAEPMEYEPALELPPPAPTVRIGVAMDRAFTFYYPENLEALRDAGAEIVPFSPIKDTFPEDLDGLYIGGGFPEVHMEALEANAVIRASIKRFCDDGNPVYAECGGLMYLCSSILWQDKKCDMVDIFPYEILMSARPKGHGYMVFKPTGKGGWPAFGDTIKAHEFHHSSISGITDAEYAFELDKGSGIDGSHDGLTYKMVLASYAHIHSLGTPNWAHVFVGLARANRNNLKSGTKNT